MRKARTDRRAAVPGAARQSFGRVLAAASGVVGVVAEVGREPLRGWPRLRLSKKEREQCVALGESLGRLGHCLWLTGSRPFGRGGAR